MKFFTSLLIALLFSSCMSTVNMQIMRPAQISVPSHIRTVAIVNRTASSKEALNVIEGILTGEGIGQDREGARQVLAGAQSRMSESGRYNIVMTNIELKGGVAGNMAPPLSWDEVAKICSENKSDALLVLEEFDTDWVVTNGSKPVKKKDAEGREITVTQFWAEGIATARIGFRLYDPEKRTITDQYRFSHNKRWSATGNSITDAMGLLINKRIATNQVSVATGRVYAERITPSWYNAQRQFYKKSKGNAMMKQGRRRADVGDWNGAAESWQTAAMNGDPKTRGRAAYNMALANEVNGNLDEAKSWAEKSYTDYGNKKARLYSNILRNRIYEAERVREQMEGSDQE